MSAQGVKGILRISLPLSGKNNAKSSAQVWIPQASLSTSNVVEGGHHDEVHVEPRRRSTMAKDGINLANMKRGSGYRSSFSGQVATIFGGTGMVARGVTNRLGKTGTQMIIPYRGEPYFYQRLKVCGDLGQVLFTPFELKDEESIKNAMKYSDIVINLIGREYETFNYKFEDVNVKGPALLAKCAREMGVKRFVHISSINARENPERLYMPYASEWLRTKWEGERAIFDEFPDATIFRACELYGFPDYFVHYYNNIMRRPLVAFHKLALWKKGLATLKSPLWVSDLTSGIMASLEDPSSKGQIYDAMGPETYVLADLLDWMHDVMDKDEEDFGYVRQELMLSPTTFLKAGLCQFAPLGQKYYKANTLERLERSQLTEESEGYPGLESLGVKLHSVKEKMPPELQVFQEFADHEYLHDWERIQIREPIPLNPIEAKAFRAKLKDGKNMIKAIGL